MIIDNATLSDGDRKAVQITPKDDVYVRTGLESLMDAVPACVLISKDPAGTQMVGNNATNQLLGLPAAANVSLSAPKEQKPANFQVYDPKGNLIAPKDLPVQRAGLTGEPVNNVEFELRFSDGRSVWLSGNALPLFSEEGSVRGAIGVFTDITVQKKTEQALKENEQLYHTVFDNSEDAFELIELIYDASGKPVDHRYLNVNNAFARQTGIKEADVVGKTIKQIFPNVESIWFEVPDRVLKTGKTEHTASYNQDTKRWYDAYFFPYAKNTVGGLFRDITEHKKLEKQLQENGRLAAIGQTASMVGHDIRNPLQAIISDVYLLKDYLISMPQGQMKADVAESLEGIEKNITYVNKIVADLQDYTRVIEPKCLEVNLCNLFGEVFQTIAIPSNVVVSIDILPSLKLKTDSVLAKRIFSNLIINAMQAMPDGGKLEISANQTDCKIAIHVSDTGVGIPEDVKPKLFTPLMTTKAQGQGLGLAVVKRLVTTLNGTIGFESEVGKGTRFIVNLPI